MPDEGAMTYSRGSNSINSPVSCETCDEENFEEEDIFSKDISALFKPIETALEAAITAQVGGFVTPDVKLKASGGLRTCCEMGSQGYEVYGSAGAALEISVGPAIEPKVGITVDLEGVGMAKVEGSLKIGIQATGGVGLSATVSSGCNFSGFELSGTAE